MNYPPPLPVRRLTRWDFYGVLFINFDAAMPWADARRQLEKMIREAGFDEITPGTIQAAFSYETTKILRNFPGPEIERRALAVWKERCDRLRAAGHKAEMIKPRYVENGADPADPLATFWDPKRRRGYFIRPDAAEKQLAINRRKLEARLKRPPAPQPQPSNDWSF